MSDWKIIRLYEIGKIVTGKTPETIDPLNYGSDFMFLGPSDLHKHFIVSKSEKMISTKGLLTIKGSIIDGLSILVGCIGWDMGNVALVKGKCATNQQINSITQIKEAYNTFYIYYWFKQKKQYLFQIASVTRTPMLKKSDFSNIELNIPNKNQQDKVSNILIALDSKIELNNRINAELESMAKTLYDYWFVQFDFPDKNGKPYKTSGCKMVWNEELKRKIPEGWKKIKMSGLYEFQYGFGNTNPNNGGEYPVYGSNGVIGGYDKFNNENAPVIGHIGNNCGSLVFADGKHYVTYNGVMCKIRKGYNKYFGFMVLQSKDLKSHTRGSSQPFISYDMLNSFDVVIPETNFLKTYCNLADPLFDKVIMNNKQNQQLTSLRDWLLPMLMNGQVIVKEEKETDLSMAAEPKTKY